MSTVQVVLPEGVGDLGSPSGGNVYDRRLCDGLSSAGWAVEEHHAPGAWPFPDDTARAVLAATLAGVPDDSLVVLDGMVASSVPDVLLPEARRLRLVVLVHLPLGVGTETHWRERAVLAAARAVVTTSRWTRSWLIDRYGLRSGRLHVVEPGVDAAEPAVGTEGGGALLCVAAVVPDKGHDVLLAALARVADLPWHLLCAGSLSRDETFVRRLREQVAEGGVRERVELAGPLTGAALEAAYAAADALVLASRVETFGMVVTEALARGIPVLATRVGGIPDTLGGSAGAQPGLLVPPGDPAALASALRVWLTNADQRGRLRTAALGRRAELAGWQVTARRFSAVLEGVSR